MKKSIFCRWIIGIGAMTFALSSYGSGLSLSNLKFNGFATVGAVATNTDNDEINYAGGSKDPSFDPDTKVGLQFNMPVHDKLDFTTQIIAKGSESYNIELEWAFGTFKAHDNVKVRLGRLRIPFFRISDSLLIGYSYPWVRPPIDTYGQFSFSRFNGIDSIITIPLEDSAFNIQPFYGSAANDFELMGMAGEFSIKNLAGLKLSWVSDWMSIRLGHTEGDYEVYGLDSALGPLAGIMRGLSGDSKTADLFEIRDRHGQFTGLGIDVNVENFLFLAEYNIRKTDGLMNDNTSWYTTFGYRFGDFLPHLTYSRYKTDTDYSKAEAALQNIDPMSPGATDLIQGFMGVINFSTVNQSSLTAGLRYDFMPKTTLKIEWQRVMPDEESSLLSPPFDGSAYVYQNEDLDDVDIYSIAVDFVF